MSDDAENNMSYVPHPSINFEDVLSRLDRDFGDLPPSMIERFRFSLDGMNFDLRRVTQEDGAHRILVNATLGYMPFTVESAERREAVKTIVMASRALPNVRFFVDTSSKIMAGALFDMAHVVSPDFIFHPLCQFLQEARPYIQLIGQYISPPKVAAPAKEPAAANGGV